MTADQLQDIYTLVLTDPCYYVKYGMGYINTCEIIKEEQEKYPDASDMEIHTAYLNALSGTYCTHRFRHTWMLNLQETDSTALPDNYERGEYSPRSFYDSSVKNP